MGTAIKTPAFISSSASQELFECADSATCARSPSVPIRLQLARAPLSLSLSAFTVYIWPLQTFSPASIV